MKRSRLRRKRLKQTGLVGLMLVPTEVIGKSFKRKRRKK